MSCTCNQSINCDPCAFCTPPGVTCLTACAPVQPCEEKIDIDCVIYSGENHPCSDIEQGQPVSQILLQALSLIFPLEECCYFEATAVAIIPPPQQYTFCRSYEDGDCERACGCDETTSIVSLYSLDNPLVVGSVLYSDPTLSIFALEGWYSANGNCIIVSGGPSGLISGVSGAVQSISPCVAPTTTPVPTTTIPPCYCFTVTMISTNTIDYIDCEGDEATSPTYTGGEVIKLCAEYITPNIGVYTITNPSQYCVDRLECPATTTTTTIPPTTTTTTLPICKCITFTNFSDAGTISWVDCLGRVQVEPIPAKSGNIPNIVTRCGSSGTSNGIKIDVSIGDPCIGLGADAYCNIATTTTIPCSQFILQCCKNNTGTPIIIQPCHPNTVVPFALGNVYIDEQSRYWVVMGTSGTPTITTGIPLGFAFFASYQSPSVALAACQTSSVNQIALCPGITTTQVPATSYRFTRNLDGDCGLACLGGTPITYYSPCPVLTAGNTCRLYVDSDFIIPLAQPAAYSDGATCYTINNSGYVTSINTCGSFTTTQAPVTTTTAFTKTIQVNNQLSSSFGNIRINNVGSLLGENLQPIPTATWATGPATNPSTTSNGTYTLLGTFQQLAVDIGPTTVLTNNFTVYLHLVINGSQVETVLVPLSETSQVVAFSARTFTTGQAIIVNLNRISS